jgi:hypothetical protein
MYFAILDNNKVVNVVVSDSETNEGKNLEGKNTAGIGWTYHPDKDNFSPPQPYPSWTLDDACIWQPPITRPEGSYTWNEETQSWDEDDLLM